MDIQNTKQKARAFFERGKLKKPDSYTRKSFLLIEKIPKHYIC